MTFRFGHFLVAGVLLISAFASGSTNSARSCEDIFRKLSYTNLTAELLALRRPPTPEEWKLMKDRNIQEAREVFHSYSPRIKNIENLKFKPIEPDGTKRGLTSIKRVFPDYDPLHDLLVGVEIDLKPQEGRLPGGHIYMISGGSRFDGGNELFFSPEPHHNVKSLNNGVIFRFKNVPEKATHELVDGMKSDPKIYDRDCYSALAQFIHDYSGLRFPTSYPNLPHAPYEFVRMLIEPGLLGPDGKPLEKEVVNTSSLSFEKLMDYMFEMERKSEPISFGISEMNYPLGPSLDYRVPLRKQREKMIQFEAQLKEGKAAGDQMPPAQAAPAQIAPPVLGANPFPPQPFPIPVSPFLERLYGVMNPNQRQSFMLLLQQLSMVHPQQREGLLLIWLAQQGFVR